MGYLGNPKLVLMAQDSMPVANFEYPSDPTTTSNPKKIPCTWLNTSSGTFFICTDNTTDANVWVSVGTQATQQIDFENPITFTPDTPQTIETGKHYILGDKTIPADYTVDLPAISGNTGLMISFAVEKDATKLITLDADGTETIDGTTTRTLWAKESCILYCDGSEWVKIAGKSIPMSFAAHSNASQTGITSGTETTVNLNAEIFDVGGVFDPSTYKATIRRAAKWSLHGTVRIAPSSGTALTATEGSIKIDGGVSVVMGTATGVSGASNGVFTSVISGIVSLTAGNALILRGYATGGGTITLVGHSTNTALTTMRGVEICEW